MSCEGSYSAHRPGVNGSKRRYKMKKISLTLAVLLTLSLAACAAPEATPTPAPTEPPAPTAAPSGVEYPLLIEVGEAVSIDLNGDGTEEEILYSLVKTEQFDIYRGSLVVNGVEYATDEARQQGLIGYVPNPDYYCVTDLDESDGLLELAIQDDGPSSDYTTSFWYWNGSELRGMGEISGNIYNKQLDMANVTFKGDGFLTSYIRLGVLHTWFASCDYGISDGHTIALVPQELYYPMGDAGINVTALVELYAYGIPDPAAEKTILPVGTALKLTATDNGQWVQAETSEGQSIWLRLDAEYGHYLETPAGGVTSGQALEGLNFAD